MTDRQPIRANVRWLLLANVLVKPVWFVFLLFSARLLGAGEFGLTMLALSFTTLLMVFLEGGLDMHIVRTLSGHPERYHALVANSAALKLVSAAAVVLIAIVLSFTGHVVPFGRHLLLAALAYTAFSALMFHLRSVFRAFEIMQYEAASIIVEKVTVVLLCGGALLIRRDAETFLLAYAVAYFLSCLFTVLLLARVKGLPKGPFDLSAAWHQALRPALPFALMSVFMVVYFRSGTLLLSYLTGSDELVGYFNAGYRLVEAYVLLPTIVMSPVYPVLARRAHEGKALGPLLNEALRAILVMALLVTVPLVTFSADVTRLAYGDGFAGAAPAVAIVVLAMIPVSFTYVFGTLVAASGRQVRANWMILIVTLLNVLGNLVAIPRAGLIGAAAVTVGTEILIAGMNVWMVRDYVLWGATSALLARFSLVTMAAVIAAFAGLRSLPFPLGPAAVVVVLLAGFAALRIVTPKDARLLAGWRTKAATAG